MAIKKEKEGLRKLSTRNCVPFRGGANTYQEKALLPVGRFSMVQNLRPEHPGFRQRKGMTRKHTTADGSNKVLNLYQFSKGKTTERHFFAQMSDGDVLEATDAPPTVTTGTFGSEVHSGTASGMRPASFAHLNDVMIYSNGVDQHQLYPGDGNAVDAFWVYDGTEDELMPTLGEDYTIQVGDGDSSTVAILDALDVWGNFACVYLMTPVPANKLNITVSLPNGTASVLTAYYWKNDSSWADTSATDGTDDEGATLGQTGSITWTHLTDEIPKTQFGQSGYWYQLRVSTQLDAEVELSAVTYGGAFHDLENVEDGIWDYLIEAIFEDDSESTNYTYPTNAIDISDMTTSDAILVSSFDPLIGIFIDVGDTPNTEATTSFAAGDVEFWNGSAWTSVGTPKDNTSGIGKSGTILWDRQPTEQKKYLRQAKYTAYWYKIQISTATVTGDPVIAISGIPYFSMDAFGKAGVSEVWKDRGCYTFDKYPQYIYVSAKDRINVLNGDDFAILEAGDGRSNRVTCMRKFHNELMVWQEEKGKEGGCLTLFEGYSPTTFGKLVLSTKVGTFNAKSAVVVDGVLTSTKTDEVLKTLAFFISHYGICMTDGKTVSVISDDIQNYFDPTKTECIRRGYEDEMWVEHDTAYNILRFGLVSGSTATTPNIFPIYDLVDKVWYFDTLGQNLSCMTEVEAASGNIPILQYGGGTNDGAVYQLNTGTNDIDIDNTTIPIESLLRVELGVEGVILLLRKLILRMKVQSAGNCTFTPYRNGTSGDDTASLDMIAEVSGDSVRRHRFSVNVQGQQMSLEFKNITASQELHLLDYGAELWEKVDH